MKHCLATDPAFDGEAQSAIIMAAPVNLKGATGRIRWGHFSPSTV
jgi:hypothetical protein